jgi:hypothetical protein
VVSLGACGAVAVQAVTFYYLVQAWQQARDRERAAGKSPLPKFATVLDPPAFMLTLITRLVLGAAAGAVFHAEVNGPYAALAVGASAPMLLRQLGGLRTVRGLPDENMLQESLSSTGRSTNVDHKIGTAGEA